jgi:hypothetical protein
MDPYQAAIDEIELLGLGEDFSYTEIATRHGLDRSALSQRHQGKTQPRQVKNFRQQKLTPEQEIELVQ